MEQQRIRRRRRRRRSRTAREAVSWLTLLILGVRKLYHWIVLIALIAFILAVGFAVPALA